MNALTLIKDQHDRIEILVQALLAASVDDRLPALHALANVVEAHATMEEKLFYPTFRTARTAEALHAYAQDHQAIRQQLAALTANLVAPRFLADVERLGTMVRDHARGEEEARLLPLVAEVLTEGELDALGTEMLALFDELMTHDPYRATPAEARHAVL